MFARVRFASELERFGGELPRLVVTTTRQRQGATSVKQRNKPAPPGKFVTLEQPPCLQIELFSTAVIGPLEVDQARF
jgi:hypothetical protein